MEKATISQLKNQLSAYLRKVKAGESVLILERDQPVARIEPIAAHGADEERLVRLERAGLVRRAKRPLSLERLRKEAPRPKKSVVEALIEDRREGR